MADAGVIFVSRSTHDAGYALALIEALRRAGFEVLAQDHDILTGDDFTHFMDEALRRSVATVALLSASYLSSEWCRREARSADAQKDHRLIPLLIEEDCEPDGLLASLVYLAVLGETPDSAARLVAEIVASGKPLREAPVARRHLREAEFVTNAAFTDDTVFIGRQGALEALSAALSNGGAVAITQAATVHGQGGVGKTALARAYARDKRHLYRGVWEVRAEDRATLVADLARLAARLDDRLLNAQDQEAAARAGLDRIAQRTGRPILLIFDNAADPTVLRDWRPVSGAHILVTSRWADWAGAGARAVPLDVLEPDQGAALLQDLAGRGEAHEAEALSALLGHLPLALTHAGAVLRRNALLRFADYARDLEARIESVPKGAAYPASVRAALESNLANVMQDDPHAVSLLHIASFLAPDAIPLELWDTGAALGSLPRPLQETSRRAEAFGALATWSLITLDVEANTLSLHRLIQAVVRATLAEAGVRDQQREAALRAVNERFPSWNEDEPGPNDVRAWPQCARLIAHALAVLGPDAESFDIAPTPRLAHQCGVYFTARAEYGAAESLLRRALRRFETDQSADHPNVASTLGALAMLLQDTGRHAEAVPLARRALLIDEKKRSPDHPDVALRMSNLAQALQNIGQLDEAETLMRRALEMAERSAGENHPTVAKRLSNLAALLYHTNRLEEAEPLLRRALAIEEANLASGHPRVANYLNNLAQVCRVTGRADEAEALMRRALATTEQSYGSDHPTVGGILNNLAWFLRDAGRFAEAEALAVRALSILEQSLGAEHRHSKNAANVLRDIRERLHDE